MKTLYALNKSQELIHIQEVNKEDKNTYTCCCCGEELISRKGDINAHHFAHKNQTKCSYESYLHKLGKLKFFNAYSNCLRQNQSFHLQYKTKRTCISCKNLTKEIDVSCEFDQFNLYDLTKTFDEIYIEKGHDGFIADILLKSSNTDNVLFIEFAVTHKCEMEKVASGIRIVEVILSSEKDLDFLSMHSLNLNIKNLSFYNFKVHRSKGRFYKSMECQRQLEIFTVQKSGKAIKRATVISGIVEDLKNREFLHYQILGTQEDDYFINAGDYISLVRSVSNQGVAVKNCYACRFSANNTRYDRIYSLFCKKLKSEIPNSNFGSDCDKFWRIEKT